MLEVASCSSHLRTEHNLTVPASVHILPYSSRLMLWIFSYCKISTLFIIEIRNAASSSMGASMGCYPRICSPLWLDHVVQSISMSAIPSVTSESVSSATSAESAHAKNGSEIPFTREMNDSESLTSLQFQSRVERLDRAPDMRLSRSIAERAGAGYATQQEYCWASR